MPPLPTNSPAQTRARVRPRNPREPPGDPEVTARSRRSANSRAGPGTARKTGVADPPRTGADAADPPMAPKAAGTTRPGTAHRPLRRLRNRQALRSRRTRAPRVPAGIVDPTRRRIPPRALRVIPPMNPRVRRTRRPAHRIPRRIPANPVLQTPPTDIPRAHRAPRGRIARPRLYVFRAAAGPDARWVSSR